MTKSLLIAARELGAYRRSWMGSAVIAAGLLIDGLLFYTFALREKLLSADALSEFFYLSSGPLMIATVLLSMRLVAEERQTGTMTLLNTAPVTEAEIVIGKFLALWAVMALMCVFSSYMPLWVMVRGKISLGHILVGYLGQVLLAGAFAAIGLFTSALARSQILAGILAAVITVPLLVLWVVAAAVDPPLSQFLGALAIHHQNFLPFKEGILEFDKVVYYLVMMGFFLLAATKTLEARRWR